jgi:hypothetical protein
VLLPLMWANRHNNNDDIAVLHDEAAHRVSSASAPGDARYRSKARMSASGCFMSR